ncbi:ABC transporter ATP-binding protein [Paenibacillus elgii]|uniref:ABC transporter ATP-binding protein n=1 Tax=Paenibacillus elgii TaxID=189691 RepID=A0A2T6G933_9BACL|nr:ABC transporter ATP-binding protein [Paenibacillus elgii]PUA40668.1 ABC transporter ATP-binding protein [Paenibacillus elgii]
MNTFILQIKNLGKTIQGRKVLQDVSFDVERGEIFGLLGPNGAGKTTLFRLITNLTSPSEGQIYINGIDANLDHVESAKYVGAIIETPQMYPFLTAFQNLAHFSLYSGHRPDKKNIHNILTLVGLKDVSNKKVKTFSLGMKQRLGLAQALLHDPDLILLDEPTNGMDPVGMKEFREYLHHLTKERNKTVVISSHLLSEMEFLCDRVAFILQGKLRLIESMHAEDIGKETIQIEVDQVEQAVELIKGCVEIVQLIDIEEEALVVCLRRENISDILSVLIQHQIKVYSVQNRRFSLEEKFMDLAKEGNIDTTH